MVCFGVLGRCVCVVVYLGVGCLQASQRQNTQKQHKQICSVRTKQTQTSKTELTVKIKQDIIGGVFCDSLGVRRETEAFDIKTHSVMAEVFSQLEKNWKDSEA